jgi:release factor glutamine methyltransferase
VPVPEDRDALVLTLADAGFLAAAEEADALIARAAGDPALLETLLRRRLSGEPLAWITGAAVFCGLRIGVAEGVYVPRWQSEPLALRASRRLPVRGVAVDLCTGSGAVAAVLAARRPRARVVATEIDGRAVECARANGVEVHRGDLFAPLPEALAGSVDVVVGVVPYVPTPELGLLQRDTLAFESRRSYDGGRDGTVLLRRAIQGAPRFLRAGGALLLELGGGQADALGAQLAALGYVDVALLRDAEGDVRGIEATLGPCPSEALRRGVAADLL